MTTTQSKNQSHKTTSNDASMSERVANTIDTASSRLADVVDEKGTALAQSANRLVSDASDKARYLRESEPKQLGADLLNLIKRHPIVSLAIGAGIGLFISRRLRS